MTDNKIKQVEDNKLPVEMVRDLITTMIQTLGFIPLEQLHQMAVDAKRNLDQHEAFAPVLNPGAYLDGQRSGAFQDAKYQAEIVQKVYELMAIAHERENFVKALHEKVKALQDKTS